MDTSATHTTTASTVTVTTKCGWERYTKQSRSPQSRTFFDYSGSIDHVRAVLLHVPKTGGSTAAAYFKNCDNVLKGPGNGSNHNLYVREALDRFPGREIIFGVREPVRYGISSALCRQGFGRPGGKQSSELPKLTIPPMPEDRSQEKYVYNTTEAEQNKLVPICDPSRDLPVLWSRYGCPDELKPSVAKHTHESHPAIELDEEIVKDIAQRMYPVDWEHWRKWCGRNVFPWRH